MSLSASKVYSVYFWLLVALLGFGWAGWARDGSQDFKKQSVNVPLSRSIWLTSTETPAVNMLPERIRRRRASERESASSCMTPPQPLNGQYKLDKYFCEDDIADCSISEGVALELSSQLVFTCNPGYRPLGKTDVFCRSKGEWTPIPSCIEVKCDSLNSASTIASCSRYGKWLNCDSPAPPETRAEISCRPGYKRDTDFVTTRSGVVNCNIHGNWEPHPIKCIPACGLVITPQRPLAIGATPARIGDFPWHASLFVERNSQTTKTKHFMCGGTIIQTNLVLTAAHCVYDETTKTVTDAAKLFVITGNIFRDYDSPLHNPDIVRKAAVKNVLTYCSYFGLLGNYNADIALLELQSPFEFSRILLPACLDDSGYNDQFLVPGAYGKVAGFGRTADTPTSGILQTLTVPYVSYTECRTPKHSTENQVFFSSDKFCAGYNNGSAVCEGDSGGGLVFKKGELWYVMGIVSVGLGVDIKNGERTCVKDSYTLYTKVSNYITWIRHVLFYMEREQPFPPCNSHSQSPTIPTPAAVTQKTNDASTSKEKIANGSSVGRVCGRRNSEGIRPKLTGDTENDAQFYEFPWTVDIITDQGVTFKTKAITYKCMGALIHERAVLTTAWCAQGLKNQTTRLKIRAGGGVTQSKSEIYSHQDRDVETIVIVDKELQSVALHYKIAILILKTPVYLTENVGLACLPQGHEIFDNYRCSVALDCTLKKKDAQGEVDDSQRMLEKINRTVIPHSTCQARLRESLPSENFNLHASFVCADGDAGKDACVRDAGGPLVCPMKNDETRYVQIGLYAWPLDGVSSTEIPGVYAYVAAFRQWIDEQMVAHNLDTSAYQA